MQLKLIRTYHKRGTNGVLYVNGRELCYTIELPWRNNQPKVSCIKEGSYILAKRYSDKFKHHLVLLNVQERSLILIHPANDAEKQLQGCIAPVTTLTGQGQGGYSRAICHELTHLVYAAMDKGEIVTLTIEATADAFTTHLLTNPSAK